MISIFNQYVSVKTIFLLFLESLIVVTSVVVAVKFRLWNQQPPMLAAASSPFFPLVIVISTLVSISGLRAGFDSLWRVLTRGENVLIVGDGPTAVATAREMERRSDLKLALVGFWNPGNAASNEVYGYPLFSGRNGLGSIVDERRVSRIIVALDDWRNALPIRELVRLRIRGIEIVEAQSALASLSGRVWLQNARPSWFVFATGSRHSGATRFVKRAMDLVLSIAGLILFCPLMCATAVAIWLDSSGSIIYRQRRVGLGGKCFELLKFRSMQLDAEAECGPQWAQKEDPRMTRVGRLLRKYRLDELPQIVNVIRGEMSVVGPRPERPVFVDQLRELIPFYDERHSVRPGITGWAQVQYPYGASVEDAVKKLEYDLFYLRSLSNLFDIAIIFRTIRVVLVGQGW